MYKFKIWRVDFFALGQPQCRSCNFNCEEAGRLWCRWLVGHPQSLILSRGLIIILLLDADVARCCILARLSFTSSSLQQPLKGDALVTRARESEREREETLLFKTSKLTHERSPPSHQSDRTNYALTPLCCCSVGEKAHTDSYLCRCQLPEIARFNYESSTFLRIQLWSAAATGGVWIARSYTTTKARL